MIVPRAPTHRPAVHARRHPTVMNPLQAPAEIKRKRMLVDSDDDSEAEAEAAPEDAPEADALEEEEELIEESDVEEDEPDEEPDDDDDAFIENGRYPCGPARFGSHLMAAWLTRFLRVPCPHPLDRATAGVRVALGCSGFCLLVTRCVRRACDPIAPLHAVAVHYRRGARRRGCRRGGIAAGITDAGVPGVSGKAAGVRPAHGTRGEAGRTVTWQGEETEEGRICQIR